MCRGHWYRDNSTTEMTLPTDGWNWVGYEGSMMPKPLFEQCRGSRWLNIVGESHQRYTWNNIAYHYLDAQRLVMDNLDRKHGDISFDNFTLHQVYMFPNIAKLLLNLTKGNCSLERKYNTEISVAVQTGSWDLSSTPVRNLIRNPKYADSIINAVKDLANSGCDKFLKLIFLTTMPYPICGKGHDLCVYNVHWKTNAAVAALDQYLFKGLLPIVSHSYSHSYPNYYPNS